MEKILFCEIAPPPKGIIAHNHNTTRVIPAQRQDDIFNSTHIYWHYAIKKIEKSYKQSEFWGCIGWL